MSLASLSRNEATEVIAAGDTKFQKGMEGIAEMEGILSSLADDHQFQYALSKECVQKAIKHWIGYERLGPEEREELFDEEEPHYQELIMPALKAFRKVEAHCKRLGRPFPTIEVMKGERKLRSKPKEEEKLEEVREEAYEEARHVQSKQSHGMMIGIQLGFLLLLWLNRDTFVGDYSGNLSNLTRSGDAAALSGEPRKGPSRLEGDRHEIEDIESERTCSGHVCADEDEDSNKDTCVGDECGDSGHRLDSAVLPDDAARQSDSEPEAEQFDT
mmetsp:Transcript_78885/g.124555  ORF Transcript_78885/g.124555 Transcript_78885/m.124555 type:complete len:272 (-) Transcript_78885:33-848(-)